MSEILSRLSDDLSETVNVAGKSVVRVEGRKRLPASGIVWSADGVVVTAHHILERDDNLKLGLPDGETVSAELAGRDPTTDVAVLRAQGAELAPPGWTEPDDVRVGNRGGRGLPGSCFPSLARRSWVPGTHATAIGSVRPQCRGRIASSSFTEEICSCPVRTACPRPCLRENIEPPLVIGLSVAETAISVSTNVRVRPSTIFSFRQISSCSLFSGD